MHGILYVYVNMHPCLISIDGEVVWGIGVSHSSLGKGPRGGQWEGLQPYLGSSSELGLS